MALQRFQMRLMRLTELTTACYSQS